MKKTSGLPRLGAALAAAALTTGLAHAAPVSLTITVHNKAAANGISFAPLHVGVHGGTFDSFDLGQAATAPIVSVAEGGGGQAWQAALAAADPTATRGTVGGLLQPGQTASLTLVVDPLLNPYFSFGAMVVPSNDFFIGNDSATAWRLFDATGRLVLTQIGQQARDIWDAGSEVFDPLAAAFVGNNDLRTDQNSVVAFNFAELAAFNGLTTGAGYVFDSRLGADSDVYGISFSVTAVPEPQTWAMMLAGLLGMGRLARRRRAHRAA